MSKRTIHEQLIDNKAYMLAIHTSDIAGMQSTLKNHGYKYDYDSACKQVYFAQFEYRAS